MQINTIGQLKEKSILISSIKKHSYSKETKQQAESLTCELLTHLMLIRC